MSPHPPRPCAGEGSGTSFAAWQIRRSGAQTRGEKLGTIDGINLFFGALLGANLGTLGTIPIGEYVKLIALLAGLVMTIRLVSVSERRRYALGMLALYLVLVALILFVPITRPKGLSPDDLHRLAATLLIWVGATMLTEFYPTREPPDDQAGA
jgi:hypothetical protein